MKEIVRRALALVLLVALPAHAQDQSADSLDALLAASEPEQPAPENGTPAQTEPAPPAPLETIPVQSEAAPPEPPKPEQRKVPRGLEEIIVLFEHVFFMFSLFFLCFLFFFFFF